MQRGNFYFGLGFALLAGLIVVVAMGVFGLTSLGVFSVTTAMAMIGIAIAMIAIVSVVTLVTLRRTLDLVGHHELALDEQAARHNDLAAKVQSQWQAAQIIRDRNQDDVIATLTARQDAAFIASQNGARKGAKAVKQAVPEDPFRAGQVHPVRDVEGIGEHYGSLLDGIGIEDTRKLWHANTTYVAGALKIAPAAVEGWQCMSELMAVTGIGKQYAELLVRSDVASIDDLAQESATPLLARIHKLEKSRSSRIQGNTIGAKAVQGWIDAARAHGGLVAHNGV